MTNREILSKAMRPITFNGPGSVSCDRAGPYPEGICKACIGIGDCKYDKTDEEFIILKKKFAVSLTQIKRTI